MSEPTRRTVLHDWHTQAGAAMAEYGGFDMPIQYDTIFTEHLATRTRAGLFDISHMGRYVVSGPGAVAFLQYVLTNNVLELREAGMAQYTMIPDEAGGAIDDAYLYRISDDEYMLVVNAANRGKDWQWLQGHLHRFDRVRMEDRSEEVAMLALQGPESERLLAGLIDAHGNAGRLPEPTRNAMSMVRLGGVEVVVSRTGYTGEPVSFELFPPAGLAVDLWTRLLTAGGGQGAVPVGLGARDTLRLEAGLPLYGQELGTDPAGRPIPIYALLSLANSATSFAQAKGNYVGRDALRRQHDEVRERLRLMGRFDIPLEERAVPRFVRRMAILNGDRTGPGVNPARHGHEVRLDGELAGWVTSGTTVPYRHFEGEGLGSSPGEEQDRRAIALAYVDSRIVVGRRGQALEVAKPKGRALPAMLVPSNMRPVAPYSRSVVYPEARRGAVRWDGEASLDRLAADLARRAAENTRHRQTRTINLIPSEQTPSLFVRLLCGLDPTGRYAEHRRIKGFGADAQDVYYYQGTEFIAWVEAMCQAAVGEFLGCRQVETRAISGQMANKVVFSGLVDHFNSFGKGEPERLGPVMNNHLGRGGHLSAQYLGALRHFVRRDRQTDKPAVVNFPIEEDNSYRIDVHQTLRLIERHQPQLIIFGKSMVLHPEPVREIAEYVADWPDRPLIMYDMAHVLGLVGRHFQEPFGEGADLVTGSTHKTFYGPQRGVIASNMVEGTRYHTLWEKIESQAFPGAVSNHHLGTLLGLLGATYEMLAFREEYQQQVIANAQAFARSLSDCGIRVMGDATLGYTQTHQVIIEVGGARGPEVARRLEASHVVANYQALPADSSFSDASGIRLGVQEMTRFGMLEDDFGHLAELMADIILREQERAAAVTALRQQFLEMRFCFPREKSDPMIESLLQAFANR
ncbi:MAG: glycine cleavage system aminomethyltransferase GcvT [Gemmatimonadota bacterium]